ncbi:MAG: cob(I)yrinic acid a,c-diamide adenosyltransferase [Spirochaetaceae bacterium]|nr:MAG: cob(I)yrinic acid a,c-diamide adenosyltransferase [Spirochaetaceae bacterium]
MKQGFVQIYTGDGKGKTTAALGLALRAAGRGLKVFIAQFAKGMFYGELEALKRFAPQITLQQYGRKCFIEDEPTEEDMRLAREGWKQIQTVLQETEYDLLILDEIGIALHYSLVSLEEVTDLIRHKPETLELVLTGRKIPEQLYQQADLVTEMREIKHYYNTGVKARKGIEF